MEAFVHNARQSPVTSDALVYIIGGESTFEAGETVKRLVALDASEGAKGGVGGRAAEGRGRQEGKLPPLVVLLQSRSFVAIRPCHKFPRVVRAFDELN